MVAKKPTRTRRTNPNLRKDILVQLNHLRSETKEISRIYLANLQRDMVQLIDFINQPQNGVTKNRRRLEPMFVRMKEALDGIHVKPEKGRRKDLRKIEQAIRSMVKVAAKKADA